MSTPTSSPSHWDRAYRERGTANVSWYQPEPALSLELLERAGLPERARVLDVGGGTSRLADRLLERGCRVGVLELSGAALDEMRARLGVRAGEVEWFHGDVRTFESPHPWDAWHDRAVFHFLTEPADRAAYRERLLGALRPGGALVMATFGPNGPERCSGLPTARYSAEELADELGPSFEPISSRTELHATPQGKAQEFTWVLFRRVGA